jgi:hypothetical protein
MGFVIQMAPRKAEDVLASPGNAVRGQLGAKTAAADPQDAA